MNDLPTHDPIYDLIVTENDRNNLLSLITNLKAAAYKTGQSNLNEILSQSREFAQVFDALVPKNPDDMEERNQFGQKLEEIEEEIKKINSIEITLAIAPNQAILKSLKDFTSDNFEKKVIFNIIIDPAILGGIIVVIEGKYIDLSLSRKLEEAFKSKKDEIKNLLHDNFNAN